MFGYLQVRVLGMDLEKGVLDVTMDTELVKVSHAKRSQVKAINIKYRGLLLNDA